MKKIDMIAEKIMIGSVMLVAVAFVAAAVLSLLVFLVRVLIQIM